MRFAAAVLLAIAFAAHGETLRVGSKRFTESYILGEVLIQVAQKAGATAEHKPGLGNTGIVFAALKAGSIDLYPEYTGTIAKEILKLEGYEVSEARNGREGVERARKEPPDLVLCDITMPEMNGHRVLQNLREDTATAHLPFIFLTGWGEKEDLRTGMNLGADDYLVKPVEPADLIAAVDARLRRRKQAGRRTCTFSTSSCPEPAGGIIFRRRLARPRARTLSRSPGRTWPGRTRPAYSTPRLATGTTSPTPPSASSSPRATPSS